MNGKALMSGVRLLEMEASDMMDVLHFLFEEDFTAVSEDHSHSRSALRDHLYTTLYGTKYSFKVPPRKDAKGRTMGGTTAGGSNEFDYSDFEAAFAAEQETFDARNSDPFSPRNPKPKPTASKAKFVSGDSVPVNQTFNPDEALG
ncbi:hypothetical protein SEA_BIG4_85 [Microbacterium phage Big4]|nr:hypothetical protein SEA_BIG4_85 [Microbacterium phage Big4]